MTNPSASGHHDLSDVGDLVERLSRVARANGVTTLTVTQGALSIELSLVPAGAPSDQGATRQPEQAMLLTSPVSTEIGELVTAPMVGTYYAGSGPSEPPFVVRGDRIEVGQTIGIIEAMKIMNEIPSEAAGVVVDVLVSNGQAVEYGTPLLRIVADIGAQG